MSVSSANRQSAPLVAKLAGDFRPSHLHATRLAIRQTAFICGTIFSVVVVFKDPGISRFFLGVYISALLPLLAFINRVQPQLIARRYFAPGRFLPTLLVGSPVGFDRFATWLRHQESLGTKVLGQVTFHAAPPISGIPVLGGFHRLEEIVRTHQPKQVIVLEPPWKSEDAARLLRVCLAHGTRLYIHNRLSYQLGFTFDLISDDSHSFLTLQDEPLEDPVNRGLKRLFDIVFSAGVIVTLLLPLAAVVALMQRLQSPGPLLYAQTRTGLNRATFRIFKFRTMHATNPDPDRPAAPGDDRIFPFGRFLRRSSLDELPQFWNVLRGEMSTVGPRPHLQAHSDAFTRDVDTYLLRYFAKPGVTGLAQCNGLRGHLSNPQQLHDRIRLDLKYIGTWSLWLDLWIILKTVRQVIFPPASAV